MYNKKVMISLFAGLVAALVIGVVGYFKGDVLLFAITNSAQVRAEKAQWDAYVNAYGKEASLPKGQ